MSTHPDVTPLVEAATLLGITPEAARKRIQRGTLAGEKIDGTWFVQTTVLPNDEASRRQDDRPDNASGHHPDDDLTAGRTAKPAAGRQDSTSGQAPVDLQPLADVIERLHAENVRLTEAATVWQLRAVQAEGRLAQLTAGDITSDGESEAETAHGELPGAPDSSNEDQEPGAAISAAPRGWRERMATWFRGS